jgi:hypothetical protein
VQQQFCHGRECGVVRHNTDGINDILAILRSKDQQLLKSIEIEAV